jgi:hypothetical protein
MLPRKEDIADQIRIVCNHSLKIHAILALVAEVTIKNKQKQVIWLKLNQSMFDIGQDDRAGDLYYTAGDWLIVQGVLMPATDPRAAHVGQWSSLAVLFF